MTLEQLKPFVDYHIDWNLTPEHAVTMYLEWGNNDWKTEYGPVTSKTDISIYFVIDTWGKTPSIRLVKRNSEGAEDLADFPVPEELLPEFKKEFGSLKGVFTPPPHIKNWLRTQIG